jgi:hypothetical protein
MFAGARIARHDLLSRLPTDGPSAAVMRTWYGPPEIEPAPTPRPGARMLGAIIEEEHDLAPSAVDGTEYVSVMCAYCRPIPDRHAYAEAPVSAHRRA